MSRIAIYCGAKVGDDLAYQLQTKKLIQLIAKNHTGIVYGGGNIGLMGIVADEALSLGLEVIGVMPQFLKTKEIAHTKLTAFYTTETMHERKHKMMVLADAFIALPGGPGTLEEISEVYSWKRVGQHDKPCVVYNIGGYYNFLEELLGQMTTSGFLTQEHRDKLLITESLNKIVEAIKTN